MLTWQHIRPGWNPGSLQGEHHLLVHHSLVSTLQIRGDFSTHKKKTSTVQHIRNGKAYVKKEISGSDKVKLIFQDLAKTSKKD
jgi:hypothetical protein